MISIIVSSYKEDLFLKFSENVKQTIGDIPYEIIQVLNPGLMGICKAYNRGAKKAQYSYLVFSHEDISFHTDNWGAIINTIFEKDTTIGLIGCAGGFYKSLQQTGWATDPNYLSSYMIGTHFGSSHLSKTYKGTIHSVTLNAEKKVPNELREIEVVNEEVLMLDGMFLCTRKTIHENLAFDESIFKGFHCYDLDYSLQVHEKFKVVVNHNILIEHFSPGNFSKDWLAEMLVFNKKWEVSLPCSLHPISNLQILDLEFKCFENIVRVHKHNKLSLLNAFKPILKLRYIRRIGITVWIMLLFKILEKFTTYPLFILLKRLKKNKY
ncbi:MAG: hypothetical protein H7Y07_16970 [Pyrinomonadaceae bacterium]|nr:hypothetical protein [Sphingobacteriaceae bacterium]